MSSAWGCPINRSSRVLRPNFWEQNQQFTLTEFNKPPEDSCWLILLSLILMDFQSPVQRLYGGKETPAPTYHTIYSNGSKRTDRDVPPGRNSQHVFPQTWVSTSQTMRHWWRGKELGCLSRRWRCGDLRSFARHTGSLTPGFHGRNSGKHVMCWWVWEASLISPAPSLHVVPECSSSSTKLVYPQGVTLEVTRETV